MPWAEYPSLPTRNVNNAVQAVVRGYNLTNGAGALSLL